MFINNQSKCDMAELNSRGFCIHSNWNTNLAKAEKVDGGGYVQMCNCNKVKPLMCPFIFKRI